MKSYNFPPLYASWIEQLIGGAVPDESRATCSDCCMCKPQEASIAEDAVFHSSTKCCTYNPILPNFLVGGILMDEDPLFAEGKAQFEREALKLSISPSGVEPHWHYWWHYCVAPFGQREQLRCPYYMDRDGGLCGIWKYRNSRCTTWFCKHDRGVFGLHFWQILSDLLAVVEKRLSEWCLRELNLQIPDQPDNPIEQSWGNWAGNEREFYCKCYVLVSGLNWPVVLEIGGSDALALADKALKSFTAMSDVSIPQELKAGSFTIEERSNDVVRVWGYRIYDPIDLPRSIFEQIKNFEGAWSDLDQELVRKLYERQILIPNHSISNGFPR